MTRPSTQNLPPGLRIEREWTDPTTGERFVILSHTLSSPELPPEVVLAISKLSSSEREVCRLINQGLSNAEIAAQRGRALRTVANQVAAIFKKVGVSSRTELIARLRRSTLLGLVLIALSGPLFSLSSLSPFSILSPHTAFADAPTGRLRCIGKTKDGHVNYTGTIDIIPFGEIFLVLWTISGNIHIGQGISQGDHFAVIYLTPDKTTHGVALYERRGADWVGVWAQSSSASVAEEIWRP